MGIALGKTPFVDWPFLYLIRAMADEIDGRFGLFQAVVKSRVSPKCLFSNDWACLKHSRWSITGWAESSLAVECGSSIAFRIYNQCSATGRSSEDSTRFRCLLGLLRLWDRYQIQQIV